MSSITCCSYGAKKILADVFFYRQVAPTGQRGFVDFVSYILLLWSKENYRAYIFYRQVAPTGQRGFVDFVSYMLLLRSKENYRGHSLYRPVALLHGTFLNCIHEIFYAP